MNKTKETIDLQNLQIGQEIIITTIFSPEELVTIIDVDQDDERLPYFTSNGLWVGPNDAMWKVVRVA